MPKPQSKTQFVLSLPSDMPAKEIVAKAKAAGLKISEAYVYTIRSSKKTSKGRISAPTTNLHVSSSDSPELAFRKMVLAIGPERAEAIVKDMSEKLKALLA